MRLDIYHKKSGEVIFSLCSNSSWLILKAMDSFEVFSLKSYRWKVRGI